MTASVSRQQLVQRFDDGLFQVGRSRGSVLRIVSGVLSRQTRRVGVARLEIGRRVPIRGHMQMLGTAAQSRQFFAQIEPFAIVARKTHRVQLSGAECRQIADNRSGCARAAADTDDLMRGFPGLHAQFHPLRIDIEILVEKEIADDRNARPGEAADQILEPGVR